MFFLFCLTGAAPFQLNSRARLRGFILLWKPFKNLMRSWTIADFSHNKYLTIVSFVKFKSDMFKVFHSLVLPTFTIILLFLIFPELYLNLHIFGCSYIINEIMNFKCHSIGKTLSSGFPVLSKMLT